MSCRWLLTGVGLAILLTVAGGWWFYTPVATLPTTRTPVVQSMLVDSWTINEVPVKDGFGLKRGEPMQMLAALRQPPSLMTPKPSARAAASRTRKPAIERELLDVWFRFVQAHPRPEDLAWKEPCDLYQERPKNPGDLFRRSARAPQRPGQYELQLVAHRRTAGDFAPHRWNSGDVIASALVQIE